MNSVSIKDGSLILSRKIESCENKGVVKKNMLKKNRCFILIS